jgi:outer membrane protein
MRSPKLTNLASVSLFFILAGCAIDDPEMAMPLADVAARMAQPSETIPLDKSQIQPLYRELLAIDLPSVVRVAAAQNIDVREAQERVTAARGDYEASVESIAPTLSPGVTLYHVQGVNRAVTGELLPANFTTLNPAGLAELLINPGQVAYDIIAAKKRLLASEQQERFAVMEVLRQSLLQYHDLVLAQISVSVAQEAVAEAEELLRLTSLRLRAGAGLPADDERARASLAGRQQDLINAIHGFYDASVALAVTLHLDPTVTLAPKPDQLTAMALVREDLSIDDMLTIAVAQRPDLQSVRQLADATSADAKAVRWGGLGPQVGAQYQIGGIDSRTPAKNFALQEEQYGAVGIGWIFSLTTLGRSKSSDAVQRQAMLEAERTLETVRADVVRASEASATEVKLIPTAKQQVESAEEALRLAQTTLEAGTALVLDVLQAEDALNQARQNYASAVVNYNKSQINLLAALGSLDQASVSATGPTQANPGSP